MILPPLHELLEYQNPLVIKRFRRNFPAFQEKAETIFSDLLKYLWLCMKHESDFIQDKQNPGLNFSCVMHQEMRIIDEMWHTFILITVDYADFCDRYFGKFIHHVPEVGDENEKIEKTAEEQALFENQLRLFLSYAYDHLGEETVRSWFEIYLT